MLDILNDYLGTATTSELHGVLRQAYTSLTKISNYDYDGAYTEILMTDGDRDVGESLELIVQTTRGFLHEILHTHGVRLSTDTTIEVLTRTIDAIMEIPTYGNSDELFSLIAAEHSPIETFSEIMAVMTSICAEEYMLACVSINPAFIKRISELVTQKQEETLSEEELLVRGKHVEKLRRYSAFIHKEDLTMMHLVKDGMPVGYPFALYLEHIGRRLENWPAERIAHELYAMALCSVDGIYNPRAIIGANINNYIADTSLITKVDIIVNDIMVKMNSHE